MPEVVGVNRPNESNASGEDLEKEEKREINTITLGRSRIKNTKNANNSSKKPV
jgi:hypothetical protein